MSTRSLRFSPGEFYHVYNRGVDKRTIFSNNTDKLRFLERMYLANGTNAFDIRELKESGEDVFAWDRGEPQVAIGAYCLMPNHFHILLAPLTDTGLSTFMTKLATSYVMYFNSTNNRSGALFEGKFKAQHVTTDEYLKYLFSYIHLNPIKLIQSDWKERGIVNTSEALQFASSYYGSSLAGYVRKDKQGVLVRPEYFPQYFRTVADHTDELLSWLQLSVATPTSPRSPKGHPSGIPKGGPSEVC